MFLRKLKKQKKEIPKAIINLKKRSIDNERIENARIGCGLTEQTFNSLAGYFFSKHLEKTVNNGKKFPDCRELFTLEQAIFQLVPKFEMMDIIRVWIFCDRTADKKISDFKIFWDEIFFKDFCNHFHFRKLKSLRILEQNPMLRNTLFEIEKHVEIVMIHECSEIFYFVLKQGIKIKEM